MSVHDLLRITKNRSNIMTTSNTEILSNLSFENLLAQYKTEGREFENGELFIKLLSVAVWNTHHHKAKYSYEWLIENIGAPEYSKGEPNGKFELWYSFDHGRCKGIIDGDHGVLTAFSTAIQP